MRSWYDLEAAALLVLVETQLQLSREVLAYVQARGVPGVLLAGPRAEVDQLQAGVAEARRLLLTVTRRAEGRQQEPER